MLGRKTPGERISVQPIGPPMRNPDQDLVKFGELADCPESVERQNQPKKLVANYTGGARGAERL